MATFGGVRLLLPLLFITLTATCLRAQEQEGKLVNRLLKPNMGLQNPAQAKRFVADRRSLDKKASVSSFHVRNFGGFKTFGGQRPFSARKFSARPFSDGKKLAYVSSKIWKANARGTYRTGPAWAVAAARESKKSAGVIEFRTGPFTGQGKSQKAISQHDTPLTIEQVRELLNKNK